jgi:hypothetical protein
VKLFIEMREQLQEMERRAAELERELSRRARGASTTASDIVPLRSVVRFSWQEDVVT